MVLGFALLLAAYALINSGWTGRGIGAVLQGMPGGRGFALSDISVPDVAFQTAPARASGGGGGTQFASFGGGGGSVSARGGAKAIVDGAAAIARPFGTHVVSAYRPGDPKDHGSNDADRAARDIAKPGVDAIKGPPSPELDRAMVAIGEAFGRNYGDGRKSVVDTFNWQGFRIQIIYRTPAYGGHLGHIHIGARKL